MDAAADGSRAEVREVTSVGLRGRLFRKYALLLAGLVSVALIANGLLDIWFSYREQRALLVRIQAEQAATVAARISDFVTEIEGQMGWTTQLAWNTWDIQQRRLQCGALHHPGGRARWLSTSR
jgi:two-component system, NtrC family, sensor kinase